MTFNPLWQDYGKQQTFEPGEYIVKEGDPGEEVYLIVRGQVAIIKGADSPTPLVLAHMGPDRMFGEVSLLKQVSRTASVLAVDETTVLAVPQADFWRMFHDTRTFRQMVMETVIGMLLSADESRMRSAAAERDLFDRLGSLYTEHERLAELMQLRQETMRFIVHDLRNPLNLVTMALSMIGEDPGYAGTAQSRRFLTLARGGINRMMGLIDSLLDVERLESGEAGLDLSPVDLAGLIEGVVEQHRAMGIASKVAFRIEHRNGPPPPLAADRVRIERVLVNLIDNGLKFSPPEGELLIFTEYDDQTARIAVEDSGPGIPPEQRRRVFDRFVQVGEPGYARRGFGLGLAYCRSAVSAHGGHIWVEEGSGGRGSRFVFSLPFGR